MTERSLLNQERMERYINRRKFEDDFLQGQKDCQKGEPAKLDGSKAYLRGFSTQYTHDQNMSELTK